MLKNRSSDNNRIFEEMEDLRSYQSYRAQLERRERERDKTKYL
jgi:hypothetical protein